MLVEDADVFAEDEDVLVAPEEGQTCTGVHSPISHQRTFEYQENSASQMLSQLSQLGLAFLIEATVTP